MSKVDKKRKKLQERINYLQDELTQSLTKKTSTTIEINVGEQQRKIAQVQKELSELK